VRAVRHDPFSFVRLRANYIGCSSPGEHSRDCCQDARPRAGRWWAVHAVVDAPFVVAVLLARFALARRKEVACLLALWVVLFVALVSLMLWAGGRWRLPIEPVCIVLSAVVVAGGGAAEAIRVGHLGVGSRHPRIIIV
jgi:hypothetical protein